MSNQQTFLEQLDSDSVGFSIGISGQSAAIAARDWDDEFVSYDSVSSDTKYRVLVTYDGTSPSVYVNTTQGSGTNTLSNGATGAPLRLGRELDNSAVDLDSDAVIDDVIVYDSVLTSSEIQQDYDAQPWS